MAETNLHMSGAIPSKTRGVFYDDASGNNNVLMPRELFTSDSLLEICNSFWARSPGAQDTVQPYLRGCKWSPDGTCCLSVVNRDGFHVMELPRDLYDGSPTYDRMITLLPAVIHVKEAGLVYDFCWYPTMNSHYPETCSWISTKSNSPIQMWDAYDGSLKCSYRGYNAVDEMEPAISVMFINNGQKIVGGYKNCLRTFDVERPGRDFSEHKIKSAAASIASSGKLVAVGSWNSNLQLFSIHETGTYRSVGNLHAHKGGITHLMFTPDGSKLVSGARKDHNICVWDVRYFRRPLNILRRCVTTNQRIYFDISSCGRYLVSGGTDGVLRIWDNKLTKWTEQFNVNRGSQENATFRFQLYSDCCNSVSIHPSRPIIATGSGQFHMLDPVKTLEFECDESITDETTFESSQQSSKGLCSTEQTGLGDINVHFTGDLGTVSTKEDKILTQDVNNLETVSTNEDKILTQDVNESTTNEFLVMTTTKEIPFKSPDHSIREEDPTALDTSDDSPPIKKPKWDNDVNLTTTNQEIIDAKTSVSILNAQTCNDNSNPANINNGLVATNLPTIEVTERSETHNENNFYNNTTINKDDKPTPQVTENSLVPGESSDHTTTNEAPDCSTHSISKCEQYNVTESSSKNNDEVEMVSNLIVTEELSSKSELTTLSTFCTSDKTSSSLLEGLSQSSVHLNQSPPKVNLSISRSPSKKSYVSNIKKPIGSKYSVNNAGESEEDHNDIDENKMKYSLNAENNLTFWWTSKVFKGNLQDKSVILS